MESIIWGKIAEHGLLAIMAAAAIFYFYKENTRLKAELKEQAGEIKTILKDAVKIITMAESKLSKDDKTNEHIPEINRIVKEILELVKKHIGL